MNDFYLRAFGFTDEKIEEIKKQASDFQNKCTNKKEDHTIDFMHSFGANGEVYVHAVGCGWSELVRIKLPEPQEVPTKDTKMYSEDGCIGTMKLSTWGLGE